MFFKCTKCKLKKQLDQFYKQSNKPDGLQPKCQSCCKKYSKNNYKSITNIQREIIKDSIKKCYVCEESKIRHNNFSICNSNIDGFQDKCKNCVSLFYIKNKEKIMNYVKEYNNNHDRTEYYFQYYKNNKKERHEYSKEWIKNNKHSHRWRTLLNDSLNRLHQNKSDTTYNMLGYSSQQLKEHLEKQGMDWNIHQIDHKVPLSWFIKTTSPNIVNDLRNLHPLTEHENKTKGNSFGNLIPLSYIYNIEIHIKEKYKEKLWQLVDSLDI